MRFPRAAVSVTLVALAFSTTALAKKHDKKGGDDKAAAEAPAQAGPRKDPKGITGISPFWESIKKGDDAIAARDIDGAKAAYQEAIRSEPQNPWGHYRMGEADLAKGDLKEAETVWESALRFSGENAALKAKILFVLADVKERQRALPEATEGWNAYDAHAKSNTQVKTYPDTPTDRLQRIETWKKLEADYAAVKDRIRQRLEEAEKKAAESAQSPQNK
jgi:tetratricopeptide (TPR) repeat protein